MPQTDAIFPAIHDHKPVRGRPNPIPQIHPPKPPAGSRVVVVKSFVVHASQGSSLPAKTARHLAYLQRDGVSRDGTAGVLLQREGTERQTFIDATADDLTQVHLIVSPADARRLDLSRYTQDLVRQMERDLGRRLDWVGAAHYNTEHPHVHLVIRGRDLDGQHVSCDQTYLYQGVRFQAMHLATDRLGRQRLEASREVNAEQLRTFVQTHADESHRLLMDASVGRALSAQERAHDMAGYRAQREHLTARTKGHGYGR